VECERDARVSRRGRAPEGPSILASCGSLPETFDRACLAQHHIVDYASVVVQPAGRFWLFQGIEAGIFGALTLALVLFSIWWIRKRIN
jgi:hypothetical protein